MRTAEEERARKLRVYHAHADAYNVQKRARLKGLWREAHRQRHALRDTEKTCTRCGVSKIRRLFPAKAGARDGCGSWCAVCQNIATNDWHRRQREVG